MALAAKLVKRFPAVLDAIGHGELHLTGLLMLGPHLTDTNHLDVLARAKFRTKREIAKLVRTLAPLPDVPDRVEPLRLVPRALRSPTWAEFVESFCPPVRELKPGERPQDWVNDTLDPQTESAERAVGRVRTSPRRTRTRARSHQLNHRASAVTSLSPPMGRRRWKRNHRASAVLESPTRPKESPRGAATFLRQTNALFSTIAVEGARTSTSAASAVAKRVG